MRTYKLTYLQKIVTITPQLKRKFKMQKCIITGKGKQFGNNVSFSQRHTKKTWKPNLQTKTVTINDKKTKVKISTQAIRQLKKQGLIDNNPPKPKIS